MPGSDPDPVARIDDLQAEQSIVLRDQAVSRSVSEIADVVSLLDSAEEHARSGLWVAVVLTYEAGAAFDAAFRGRGRRCRPFCRWRGWPRVDPRASRAVDASNVTSGGGCSPSGRVGVVHAWRGCMS